MSAAIHDFRVTDHGSEVVLLLLDADGQEVQRMTINWLSGLRLMNETSAAVAKAVAAPRSPQE